MSDRTITVYYRSIDGFSETRKYKTLKGARKRALYWLGESYDLGTSYAITGDGIGRIMVSGCSLTELLGIHEIDDLVDYCFGEERDYDAYEY